ncbi:MAG TPA: hypothetical protein VND19_08460 [Acetobacteraceae bacterium]|nr:hypothetical protein [Acetobacteraceae bacterium]
MRLRHVVLVLLAVLAGGVAARADDVSDQIDKASAAWRAHDGQGALAALDAAANLLRQARADALRMLLPLPPPGWTADPAQTSAVSAEMLGGGTSASRVYHSGAQRVQVQITTDSPMLQGMAALISSPLANASGVKTVTIGGRPVSYTESDNGYMTLVGGKIIVKVDGSKDTPEPTLRGFVAAIDFGAMDKLAR